MNDKAQNPVGAQLARQLETDPFRRKLLLALSVLPLTANQALAEKIVDLDWSDLLPEGENGVPNTLRGLIEHDNDAPLSSQQPASSGVRTEWNGRTVRLPGYIVPIDYQGTGVTAFILVPYVGACVHVPPPPANQLVFVTTEKPFESDGLFEAVNVSGKFGVSSLSTELADIGYTLTADKVERYKG